MSNFKRTVVRLKLFKCTQHQYEFDWQLRTHSGGPCFKPRPHVSAYFRKRINFYAFWPPVHTRTVETLTENASFWNHSPKGIFLKTPFSYARVDGWMTQIIENDAVIVSDSIYPARKINLHSCMQAHRRCFAANSVGVFQGKCHVVSWNARC